MLLHLLMLERGAMYFLGGCMLPRGACVVVGGHIRGACVFALWLQVAFLVVK